MIDSNMNSSKLSSKNELNGTEYLGRTPTGRIRESDSASKQYPGAGRDEMMAGSGSLEGMVEEQRKQIEELRSQLLSQTRNSNSYRVNHQKNGQGSSNKNGDGEEIDLLRKEFQDKINTLNQKYLEESKGLVNQLKISEENNQNLLMIVEKSQQNLDQESNQGSIAPKSLKDLKKIKGKISHLLFSTLFPDF